MLACSMVGIATVVENLARRGRRLLAIVVAVSATIEGVSRVNRSTPRAIISAVRTGWADSFAFLQKRYADRHHAGKPAAPVVCFDGLCAAVRLAIRCTASRRGGSSTAITTATATCRSTCSAGAICWPPAAGAMSAATAAALPGSRHGAVSALCQGALVEANAALFASEANRQLRMAVAEANAALEFGAAPRVFFADPMFTPANSALAPRCFPVWDPRGPES